MNWPDWIGELMSVIVGTAALIGAIAYFVASWRKSGAETWRGNYEALEERVNLLSDALNDKERELAVERERNAALSGEVKQLTAQVSELRQLVMQEKVPPALKEELTGATNRVINRISELEDNTAHALGAMGDRILTQMPPKGAS